jgi:FeoB-associated Cys-rich membrane protein
MNIQLIIVIALFIAAVFYVGRILFKTLTAKKGCGENCKCGVDFSNIESPKANK